MWDLGKQKKNKKTHCGSYRAGVAFEVASWKMWRYRGVAGTLPPVTLQWGHSVWRRRNPRPFMKPNALLQKIKVRGLFEFLLSCAMLLVVCIAPGFLRGVAAWGLWFFF